jgi:hypothetical protein
MNNLKSQHLNPLTLWYSRLMILFCNLMTHRNRRVINYNFTLTGQNFAMAEMKVVLATLIRRFRFESVDPVKHSQCMPDLILRPKHGIFLKIMSRRCPRSGSQTPALHLTADLPKHFCNTIISDKSFTTVDPRSLSSAATAGSEMKFWI